MAVTLTNLETKVRYLIGDNSITGKDVFTYGNSNVFTLTESNGITLSTVFKNDVELGSSEMNYDSDTGKVTVSLTMVSGDVIEIIYTYFPNYSSTEIHNYIQGALIHLSANNYKTLIVRDSTIYPEPDLNVQDLIVMITSLLIDPDNKTYRLPDVTVMVPKDLPVHEKIRRTISIFKHDTHGIFT